MEVKSRLYRAMNKMKKKKEDQVCCVKKATGYTYVGTGTQGHQSAKRHKRSGNRKRRWKQNEEGKAKYTCPGQGPEPK